MQSKGKTRAILAFMTMLVLLGLFRIVYIVRASPEVVVYVDPPEVLDVNVGDSFDIYVTAREVVNLFIAEFSMDFGPAVLNVTAINFGDVPPFLDFFYVEQVNNDEGWLTVTAGRPLGVREGLNGTVQIAKITFLVEADGTSDLHLYDTDLMYIDRVHPVHTTEDGYFSNLVKYEHELLVGLDVPDFLEAGDSSQLNATVYNQGLNNETDVELFLSINGTVVNNVTIPELANGTSYTIDYLWTPTVEATYNVTAYAPPLPDENVTANNVMTVYVNVQYLEVALFKNVDPWNYPANEEALSLYGIAYAVFSSSDFGLVDLSSFAKVVIASDQNQAFYNAMDANRLWFEDYVSGGGILEIHAADWGWHGGGWVETLPGDLQWVSYYSNYVTIVDPTHPVVTTPNLITDAELDGWGLSVHGYFGIYPADSRIVIIEDSTGYPAYLEFDYGAGVIVASSQTLEWAYWRRYSLILENSLLYTPIKIHIEDFLTQADRVLDGELSYVDDTPISESLKAEMKSEIWAIKALKHEALEELVMKADDMIVDARGYVDRAEFEFRYMTEPESAARLLAEAKELLASAESEFSGGDYELALRDALTAREKAIIALRLAGFTLEAKSSRKIWAGFTAVEEAKLNDILWKLYEFNLFIDEHVALGEIPPEAGETIKEYNNEAKSWIEKAKDRLSVLLPPVLEGDVNVDGYVSSEDFSILSGTYGSSVGEPAYVLEADFDLDGYIGSADFNILAGNYGNTV